MTLRAFLRPGIILPVLLAAALFMVAISLGDLGQVVLWLQGVPLTSMLLTLVWAAIYLALKGLQLHLLLDALDARPGWRRLLRAFAVGELALTFPLGVFAQNWILAGTREVDFGRSSSATVVMLVLEVGVALLWLAVSGIPGWPPLQPTAAVILGLGIVFVVVVLRFDLPGRLAGHIRHRTLHRVLDEVAGLLDGLKALGRWRVLGKHVLLTAAYLAALGAAFQVMGHGMGLHTLGYREATTIYAMALAAVLVSGGLFGQIGMVEVVGMSAALAWGLDYTRGLALMLGFRVAWTGAMWLLNGVVLLLLRALRRPPDAA